MAGTRTPGTTPGTPKVLRAMNDRAALDLLLEHGSLTRAHLGTLTGLSKPTASGMLARLQRAGLVVASGTDSGRHGPNAQLYALNPASAHVAALDVTRERARAAVADITGNTLGRFELPTPTATRARDMVPAQVARAVRGAAEAAGVATEELRRVVIGLPGAFDPRTGRLRYASHLPGWHREGLLEELAAVLPVPPRYDNDANLAAVAEQQRGAARGRQDFVLLWNEVGIGAALVLGGRLHRGWTGGAGEVGFLPVPGAPLLRRVDQAGQGGFQELVGATAVLRLAQDLGVHPGHSDPDQSDPGAVGADDPGPGGPSARADLGASDAVRAAALLRLAARRTAPGAEAPEGPLGELLRTTATRVATGLAAMASVLDPELIVLAGGLHLAGGEPLCALVRRELTELAASQPRIQLGEVLEEPVLTGALESALATTRDEVFDTTG